MNYTLISPNRTSPRRNTIDTITIHCVVGQCSVEALGNVFFPETRKASSNYGVGTDGRIGMYVEEKDRSWCSSNGDNDNRAITIEVASDTVHPYAVNDIAYNALINLCVDICKRNGIKELKWKADKTLIGQTDKQNMTVHRWFANKSCPGDYLYDRHSDIAEKVNKQLNPPKKTPVTPSIPMLTPSTIPHSPKEEQEMTIQEFKALWSQFRKELQDNDKSAWSKEAREWAIKTGLVQGGNEINGEPNYMWEDLMTREQLIMVLYRFMKQTGMG